jgi:hypothetical protein
MASEAGATPIASAGGEYDERLVDSIQMSSRRSRSARAGAKVTL